MIATSSASGSNTGAASPLTNNSSASRTSKGESSASKKTFQNVLSQLVAQEQADSQTAKGNAAVLNARLANRKDDPSNDAVQTTATDPNSSTPLTVPMNAQVQVTALPTSSPAQQNAPNRLTQGPKNAAAALGLGNLQGSAFAMRITSAKSNNSTDKEQGEDQAPQNGTDALDSTSANGGLMTAKTAHAQSFFEVATAAGALSNAHQSTWIGSGPAISSAAASHVTANAGTTMADAAETVGDDPVDSPAQVRTLQVQVSGESGARVDLRFVEHGGGLSLSVRTSDNTLTRGLQDSLPELSARLAEEKYQTHAFLPTGGEISPLSPSTQTSSSSNSSGSSQQQQSGGGAFAQQDGSSSGDNSGRQQNGHPDETAAWWRQLAALGKLSSSASLTSPTTGNPPANL